jgi:hypothetical protein
VALAVLGGTSTAYATATVPPTTSATSAPAATLPPGGTSAPATPARATPAPATPGAGGEHRLTAAQLATQIAQAQALTDELGKSNAAVAAAATRLARLSIEANTLLQAYAVARDAEQKARAEAARDVLLFQQLSSQAGRDRQALGQWAYQAYAASGGSLGDVSAILDILGRSPEVVSDTAAQLSYLSDQRTSAFERVRDQAQLQRDVAARAVEADTLAAQEAAKAADAKTQLDVVIQEQKVQVDQTRALHAAQVAKAAPISGLLLGSGEQAAVEASRHLRKAMVVPGVALDGSVKACGTNEQLYPNGQIPAAGLCPLYGAPAQSLRPSAAAAFNAMSLAYQRDSGAPLCVADSYRSLAEQVSVKAIRGMLAATPGRSQHGLGLAVDLCGGVEDFGSPAHLWMTQNAPLYGWFHPDWAEPTGALPEPWHWEYAG